MKTLIAILFFAITQTSLAENQYQSVYLAKVNGEMIEMTIDHPQTKFFAGRINYKEFLTLTCAAQLEELLEINEKYGYSHGVENFVWTNLDQKRFTPEMQVQYTEHVKTMEAFRLSFWEERNHKDFLFRRFCHAHKNPDQQEVNPAADKKDSN